MITVGNLTLSVPKYSQGKAISLGKIRARLQRVNFPPEKTPIFFPFVIAIGVFADGKNPTTIIHTFFTN